METQGFGLPEQTRTILKEESHYLDVVDRMAFEIGMVEYLRNNSGDKDLEGALAILSESMSKTREMLYASAHMRNLQIVVCGGNVGTETSSLV